MAAVGRRNAEACSPTDGKHAAVDKAGIYLYIQRSNSRKLDMKPDIHPTYRLVNVECACGNSFQTRANRNEETMKVEICNACHPFFTGQQKLVDTAGRVDKFLKKYQKFAQK